jgi:diguanylate cyclase (GGDEF)-like protein
MHAPTIELDAALENFPAGISLLDADRRLVFANQQARQALGLSEDAAAGMSIETIAKRDLLPGLAGALADAVCDLGESGRHVLRWRHDDGPTLEVITVPAAGGGFVTTYTDISSRVRSEALLAGQAHVLQLIAQGKPLAHVLEHLMLLIDGQVDGIKSSVLLLDAEGKHVKHGAAPHLDPEYCKLIDGVAIGPEVGSCGTAAYTGKQVIVTDIATHAYWAPFKDLAAAFGLRSCWSTPIFSAAGKVLGTFAMYSGTVRAPSQHEQDIVEVATRIAGIAIERKQIEERIGFMACHDALTGLPNRSTLSETVADAVRRAQARGRWASVVFVDLDNFKMVNDSLGHAAGDELLRIMADRMRASIGTDDTVVRLGGDEFVIVFADQAPAADALLDQVERVKRAISEPVALDARSFAITSSMGIATYPHDGADAETLVANADAAMYRSKQGGRDDVRFHAPEQSPGSEDPLALRIALQSAVARNEFVLHYQPQIDFATGQVVAVEALIRWQHPQQGLLAPGAFIGTAEETGLIVPIGEWVLKQACRQARAWLDVGYAPLRMCVNVSARQFRGDGLVRSVVEALTESGLASRYLELELTESLLVHDTESAIATIEALQELGVAVSIDDFGTGYSSLGALKTFPVSRLKIDKSFIQGLAQHSGKAVASAVVSLGHALDLMVVAEGVETEAQADFLASIGCDIAQGYFYSHPQSAAAIECLLSKQMDGTGAPLRGAA